jgi:hypothetical protein
VLLQVLVVWVCPSALSRRPPSRWWQSRPHTARDLGQCWTQQSGTHCRWVGAALGYACRCFGIHGLLSRDDHPAAHGHGGQGRTAVGVVSIDSAGLWEACLGMSSTVLIFHISSFGVSSWSWSG